MRDTRRTRLVLALLLLTAFTLITLDFRGGSSGGALGGLRGVVSAVFGPVERAVAAVVRPVGSALAGIGHIGSYDRDVGRLKRDNASLERQLRLTDDERRQLAELRSLNNLAGRAQFRIVTARVIAVGRSLGFEWTATIDAGSRDGLREGQTVINGDGLVGRVKRAGSTTSTVLLAVDGQFSVGARLEKSGEIGHVDGNGRRAMTFTLLSQQERLRQGQRLVTLDETFAPEIPVGHITTVESTPGALTRTALIAPYVDFTALDVVGVVVAQPRTVKRDSLLPASPTPSPAPTTPAPTSPATPGPSPAGTPAVTPSASASPSPSRSG
jgi:rod shape-determining protein MreC